VGATTTITLTATVDGAAAGTITNKAEVGSQGTDDPNLANNTAYKADTIFVPGYAFTNRECTLGGGPLGTGAQCSEISWQPQTSGIPLKNIYITAVDSAGNPIQLDPTNPTTVNMQFGLACIDPANHAGVPATFTGASTGSNLNGAIPLCQSGGAANWSVGAGLIFAATKTSVGPYTFNYNDVGKVELLMRNSAATTQLGSSGNFDVVPHHFGIAGIPAGPHKAGNDIAPTVAPFATVTAYNGLATPTATPNFGKESAPESATLSFVRCQPAGAAASGGAFTSAVGSFTAGVADITTLNWSEVGNGDLVATLTSGSYLGSGRTVTGNTGSSGTPCQDPGGAAVAGNVGVFIPDHFDVAVADGCVGCGFTYSGQPFDVTVTARNAFNATTVNYDGVATTPMFAHAVQLADANAVAPPPGKFSAANAQALANVDGTTLTIPVAGFTSGVATLTRVPTYTFGVTPAAPATLKMRAVDTSYVSVSSVGFAEGTTVIRSGRYRIANAHGSELLPLPIAVAVQYYNGASWLTSTTDNVTSFNSDLTANGGNLISTPVKGALAINVANAGASQVAGGVRTITLAAPGAAGSVDLTLNAPTYLLGGSNIAGANPSNAGRATFGIYKGANEFIYQRENY
jgi:MSHA biogenesis protein MshQ